MSDPSSPQPPPPPGGEQPTRVQPAYGVPTSDRPVHDRPEAGWQAHVPPPDRPEAGWQAHVRPPDRPEHDRPPTYGRQAYVHPPAAPAGYDPVTYGYRPPGAAVAPRKPLDLAKIVGIGAWVVLGLFAVAYLYGPGGGDTDGAGRLLGDLPVLGQGIFYSGVLHAVAVWLGRQQREGA